MITLQLTTFAKARISWRPTTTLAFEADGLLTRDAVANSGRRPHRFLSVEALVPRGARADYGMLGVSFNPDESEKLHVTVKYCETQCEPWPGSLAANIDDARVGLPKEYSEAVLEGLIAGLRPSASGSLTLEEAAHGVVGSSSAFFRSLARAAGELLFLDDLQETSDTLLERLRRILIA